MALRFPGSQRQISEFWGDHRCLCDQVRRQRRASAVFHVSGGNNSDEGHGIAVDSEGNAYITGYTESSDFPTHANGPSIVSYAPDLNGIEDAFVAKINHSMIVRAPNGGEIWNEGSAQTIAWLTYKINSKQKVLLYISIDNGMNWKKIASTTKSGSIIWKIPKKSYISNQALIKICLNQKTPLCDTSDALFTINKAPVAEAGVRQTVIAGTEVVLNGRASYDADNGPTTPLTYEWTQTRGPLVTLNSADHPATPSFTPTVKGTYIFGLVVNDGSADSKQDKVTVSVKAAPVIP